MITDPDALRARILFALEGLETDATDLARQLGRGPDYIRDFLKGRKKSIKIADLKKLELILETGPDFFTKEDYFETPNADHLLKKSLNTMLHHAGLTAEMEGAGDPRNASIKLYYPRILQFGEMRIGQDPFDEVPRPWYTKQFLDCYGLMIMDEIMAPAYEPGDLIIINPNLPLFRGQDFIFRTEVREGEFRANLRRLVGWNENEWLVRQFGPEDSYALSRKDWPRADRIVGSVLL